MKIVGLFAIKVVDSEPVAVKIAFEGVPRACSLGRRRAAADGYPIVGEVTCVVKPEVAREVQHLPAEGIAAVYQRCHPRQLLRRGDVEGGLRIVIPGHIRSAVPNGLR